MKANVRRSLQLVNVVHNAIVMHGTFVGIGSPDARLSPELEAEGQKVR